MISHKHITAIVSVLTAIAVVLCLCSSVFYDRLFSDDDTDSGIQMNYETELFNTDQIITINILMDDDDWNDMLENAISEEYYDCDVEVNGKTFHHVAIRPKGNTSLSSIANDSTTNRYSLKLEFDHYVEGQTCFGLDKLILNNNYADATNMKEALIYDMFQYLGADSSLYNYASISVNGDYWGVYTALESVEDSFLQRNYGTESGSLYKPDSMNINNGMGQQMKSEDDSDSSGTSDSKKEKESDSGSGSGQSSSTGSDSGSMPSRPDGDSASSGDFTPPSGGFSGSSDGSSDSSSSSNGMPTLPDGASGSSGDFTPPSGGFPGSSDGSSDSSASSDGSSDSSGNVPALPDGSSLPSGDFTPPSGSSGDSNDSDSSGTDKKDTGSQNTEDSGSGNGNSQSSDSSHSMHGGGGMSMSGNGGANLNYTDDSLSSYSTIWDSEITNTGKNDHKRVVKALKNISEGNDLEDYMDVDNLLSYMAVHVFSVNQDSLSGMMAHNYYLYESDGKLNILPWDYNLALGGMGGGSNSSSVINDAIDDSFSSTDFFDALLENDEYSEQYHELLQKLVDEYINGGGFDTFYNRVRSQIDSLVESDPNAFYSYDEYLEAVDTLYQTVKLRGESIDRQLNGTIASTSSERSSSDELVDTSGIDLSTMGTMNNGGGGGGRSFGGFSRSNDDANSSQSASSASDGTDSNGSSTAAAVSDVSSSSGNSDASASSDSSSDGSSDASVSADNSSGGGTDASASGDSSSDGSSDASASNDSSSGGGTDVSASGDNSSGGKSDSSASNDSSSGGKSDSSASADNSSGKGSTDQAESFKLHGARSSSGSDSHSAGIWKSTLIQYGISIIVMLAAFLFAIFLKRRKRRYFK